MHKLATLTLLSAMILLHPAASFAMTGTMESTTPSSGMKMAKCPAGDPAVIMNSTKHTYMLDTEANRNAMKGMMSHDKFICESQAKNMGAKMVNAPMHETHAM